MEGGALRIECGLRPFGHRVAWPTLGRIRVLNFPVPETNHVRTVDPSRPTRLASIALVALTVSACGPSGPGEWVDTDYGRVRTLAPATGDGAGFHAMTPSESGIDFSNELSVERRIANQLLTHGSGVAIGDVDGDGLPDLYLGRLDGSNALYRNLGGFRFEDVTASSGTALEELDATGVALADVDSDGDLDLIAAARGQANHLLLNDGAGVFTDVTEESGIGYDGGTTTLALADVDADGDLDLYVTNYRVEKVGTVFPPQEIGFDQVVKNRDGRYEVEERYADWFRVYVGSEGIRLWQYGEPDILYLNDGDGRFTALDWTGGRFLMEDGSVLDSVPDEWGLSSRFQDVNGDLLPDLYVSNDFESADQFWINQGNGTFRSIDPFAIRSTSASSMAVDFSDVNRDGELDFFVVDMAPRLADKKRTQMPTIAPQIVGPGDIEPRLQRNRNTLFLRGPDGEYEEVARAARVDATGWSWGTHFFDADLDGYEDIFVTNGHVWDVLDVDTNERIQNTMVSVEWRALIEEFPSLAEPNVAFRNLGNGEFDDVSESWGIDLGPDHSHGLASGDFDGDGDLDLVMNRLGFPVAIYRNDATAPRLSVELRGETSNRFGIGARLELVSGDFTQAKEITSGGLYLSSPEPIASFAVPAPGPAALTVYWPSGRVSTIEVEAGRHYEVHERSAIDPADAFRPAVDGAENVRLFEQSVLPHTHVETAYNDFERQPLLPHRLSQAGPGMTFDDVDGDGDPDLVIPSGAGGRLAILENDRGSFTRREGPSAGSMDQVEALPLPGPGGLLLSRSVYEAASPEELTATPGGSWVRNGGRADAGAAIPASTGVTGAMTAADLDGDGQLEVFVGARPSPGAYPISSPSRVFTVTPGGLVENEAATRDVARTGIVSGAVFTDLDGDGDADLVVAEDWGPVRVFTNVAGRLSDITADVGLSALRGRWNGIASGDFDGDGRMDLVVTSWGQNTVYRPTPDDPLRLYWGDFDGEGAIDLVEAVYDDALGADIPAYDLARLTTALPYVRRSRTRTFHEFAQATLEDVLGPRVFERANRLEVVTLEHQVLLNRGDRFEAMPLPARAQRAPAFHPAVADFDGDGNLDLFLTQNFFPNEVNRQRYDAGRGIVLAGDGRGGFRALLVNESGVRIYGDQRGAAVADVDGDRRPDVAVSQNGAESILLMNRGGIPGLRVRVTGPDTNPRGAGTVVRAIYEDGSMGPAVPVRLGYGYLSVDEAGLLLGAADRIRGLEVRPPNGSARTIDVAPGSTEVTVRIGEGG